MRGAWKRCALCHAYALRPKSYLSEKDGGVRILIRQASVFTAIGVVLMGIDTGVFGALHWLGLGLLPANMIARVIAALASFYLNGRYSFAGHGEARPHAIRLGRYVVWWLVMTAISTGVLWACHRAFGEASVYAAKPAVEFVLAVIAFFVSRHWIYA